MNRRVDFHAECLRAWLAAISKAAGPSPADSMTWRGLQRIREALQPFMGENHNHAHLPTGGGFDFVRADIAAEPGCLSFAVDDGMVEIMKPRCVSLEYFPDDPGESFLLLELDELTPSGANDYASRDKEEVLEYPLGSYLSRELWERGYLRLDEAERKIPLPPESRLACRWFGGKVLFVGKGSWWNGNPRTYDGRHNSMTAAQIRAAIEHAREQRST